MEPELWGEAETLQVVVMVNDSEPLCPRGTEEVFQALEDNQVALPGFPCDWRQLQGVGGDTVGRPLPQSFPTDICCKFYILLSLPWFRYPRSQ